MWPFRRKHREKPHKMMKRMIVGVVIGGAIASIVGKKLLEKDGYDGEEDEQD